MEISLNDPFAKNKILARQTLMQVMDPELNVNIIDLGLVYEINFSSSGIINIKMTFSTPFCPLGDAIQEAVLQAMHTSFPDCNTHIEIVWHPEWNFEMISDSGKEQLGLN